jgi:hypothetical protein
LLPRRLQDWSKGLQAHFMDFHNLGQRVRQCLNSIRPDLMVVDTFPRGLLGELAEVQFPCPAWLVARWLKLSYALQPPVREAVERYQQVLCAELSPWDCGLELGPVISPPQPAQRDGTILWLGSGPLQTQDLVRQVLPLGAVIAAPDLNVPRHDVAQLLSQVGLVVSAGGYNAYHEIVQAGTPAIFWPQSRLYDQQELRVQGLLGPRPRAWHRLVHDLAGLCQALQEWEQIRPQPAPPVSLARPELLRPLFT